MKTHRYCFPMRIVAMLLVLILCLDLSGASVFAAEKPQQSDTEKELALDWLTEMTGSREEAELFYARMDALGLLNGDLEPGASKLTIAGKDYTLEEAKAVLDSFADDEPVTVDRSVITVGDLRKMIEVDAQLRQTLENYDSLSPEQKTSLEDFMQALEAGNVRFDSSALTTGPSGINHAVRVLIGEPVVTDTEGVGAKISVKLTLDGTASENQTVTVAYQAVSGTAQVAAPASGTVTFAPGETEKTVTVCTNGYTDACLSGGKYNTGEMAFVLNFHALKNALFWDEATATGKTAAGVAVALTDADCVGKQVLCRDERFTIYTPAKDGCASFESLGLCNYYADGSAYRYEAVWDHAFPVDAEDEAVLANFGNMSRLFATGTMMEESSRTWTVADTTAYFIGGDFGSKMTDLSMEFSVNWNDGTGDEALTNTVEWRTEVQTEVNGEAMYDTDNFFDQYINDLKSFLAGLMLHPQSDSCSSSFRVHGEFSYWIDQVLIYHELIDPEAVRFAVDTQILDETESAPTLTVRVPDGASFAPGEVIPMTLHFSEPVQLPRGFCLRINGQDCPVLDFSACTAEDESAVLHASQSDFTIAYTATAEDAAGSLTLDPSASTLSGLTNTFGVYLDSDFDPATDDAATVIASAVSNSGIFIDLTALDDQVFLEGIRLIGEAGQSTSPEAPILPMAPDETEIQIEVSLQSAYLAHVIACETASGDTERHLYASIDGGQTFSGRFVLAEGSSILTGTLSVSPNLTEEDFSGTVEFYYGKSPDTAQLVYGFIGLFMQGGAVCLPESALELEESGFPAAKEQPISLDYAEQMVVSARITGTDSYTWGDLSDRENFIWAVEYQTGDGTWAKDTQGRVATIRVRDNNASCEVYPSGNGTFRVRLTARNGGVEGRAVVKYSSSVSISGSSAPILRIAKSLQCKTIQKGDSVVLNWSSNLTDYAHELGSDGVVYTIRVYHKQDNDYTPLLLDGYYAAPGDLTEWEQVGNEITRTANSEAPLSACTIPGSRFTQASTIGKYSYAISLTGTFRNSDGETASRTAWAFVSVKERPAVVTIHNLPMRPVCVGDEAFTMRWAVDNYDGSDGCEFILKVAGQTVDPADYTFENTAPDVYTGSYTLRPMDWVSDGALKENVSVELSARNAGDSTWSYDSVVFLWYSESAFEIYVNGEAADSWTLDNSGLYAGMSQSELLEATKHRDIFLDAQIGMNPNVNWGSVTDRVVWDNVRTQTDEDGTQSTVSGDDVARLSIRQGTAWVNFRNYPAESYGPDVALAVSGQAEGSTTVTARHYTLSQLQDELELNVTKLTGKLFLLQCYAGVTNKREVELTYTNGDGAQKTVRSDLSGFAAIYEESGIASDIFCVMTTEDGEIYAGTFSALTLLSGEGDWTKQELYPLNTLKLNKISQADFYIKDENGAAYADKPLWIHAGVYKNGVYLENARFRVSMDGTGATYSGKDGFGAVTDSSGKLSLFINTAQLMLPSEAFGGMKAGDEIKILFELEEGDGTLDTFSYVPLLLETDASLSETDKVMFGEKIVNMRRLDVGSGKHPLILEQSVTVTENDSGEKIALDLLDYRGNIGPSFLYSDVALSTTVLWWGDSRDSSGNNGVVFTSTGGKTIPMNRTEIEMPFMEDTVTRLTVNVSYNLLEDTLGLVSGERTGVKVSFTPRYGELQNSSRLLPFKLINMKEISIGDHEGEIDTILARLNQTALPGEGGDPATQFLGGAFTIVDIVGVILKYIPICSIYLAPSPDPTAFRGVLSIQKGYYDIMLHPGIVSHSEFFDYIKYLNGNEKTRDQWAKDYGNATDKLSDFWKQKKNDVMKGQTRKDIDFGGYVIVEMYYEDGGWVVELVQGGIHIGGYIERMWRKNFWLGPIPCTVELAIGANGRISYDVALDHVEDTNYHMASALINGYFRFFGGIGFDYDLLALKVGLFSNLMLFYNLKCLWTQAPDGTDYDWGNQFGLNGEVGVRARAQFLFFAVNYSYIFWDFNVFKTDFGTNYDAVSELWEQVKEGRSTAGGYFPTVSASSGTASFDPETGLVTYSSDAALSIENRNYLHDFERSWTPAGTALRGAGGDAFTWSKLQDNAYPAASPLLSDDGTILLYLSDQNDAEQVNRTRLYFSKAPDGAFPEGVSLTGPDITAEDGYTGNNGYGDSQPALAGDGAGALAAWVRCAEDPALLPGETAETETIASAMNEAEIFASIYDGSSWTTTRLTENGSPDLAPSAAITVGADGKRTAVVAWRSVFASNAENPTRFDGQDEIHYRIYTTDAGWSEERTLYNGTSGLVSGMDAAILPDGTVGVSFCVDTNDRPIGADAETAPNADIGSDIDASGREIILTIVDPSASAVPDAEENVPALHSICLTTDAVQDENPKLTAVSIDGEPHFVVGWLRVPNAEDSVSAEDPESSASVDEAPDIYLAAVAKDGTIRADLPRNLGAMTKQLGLLMSSDFDFAAGARTLEDLSVVWSETAVPEEEGAAQTDRLMAVKLVKYTDGSYGLTLPVTDGEAARLPGNTTIDCFRAVVTESGLRAVALTTEYQDEMEFILDENGEPVTVTVTGVDEDGNEISETIPLAFPKEKSVIYTASAAYQDSLMIEEISFNRDEVFAGSAIPVQLSVTNAGTKPITRLELLTGTGEASGTWENTDVPLEPGENVRINAQVTVPDPIADVTDLYVRATLADGTQIESDLLSLDFAKPDVGISDVKISDAHDGLREIQVNGYNFSSVPVDEDAVVKVGLFSNTDGTCPIEGQEIQLSAAEIAALNEGGYAAHFTMDMASYVAEYYAENRGGEVPEEGILVSARIWIETDDASGETEAIRLADAYPENDVCWTTCPSLLDLREEDVSLLAMAKQTNEDGSVTVTAAIQNNSLVNEIDVMYLRLLDADGNPILDADGREIAVKADGTDEAGHFGIEARRELTFLFTQPEAAGAAMADLVSPRRVHFDPGEGEGEMDDLVLPWEGTAALPANEFTREHYNFLHWSTEPDGTGEIYADLAEITDCGKDTTLYAQWELQTFTVYWYNGTELLETDENVPYGTQAHYDGDTPLRSPDDENHYSFTGWSDGNTVYALNGELPEVTGELTLLAQFSADAHAFSSEITQAPTCTEAGIRTLTCTVCGYSCTEPIPPTGHTAGETQIENKVPPTCTSAGSYDEVVYCTECGEEISRQTVEIPATGHSYQAQAFAPTCTEDGYTVWTCSVCGDSYTESGEPALGHSWGEAEYLWSEDLNQVTARAICTHDPAHVLEQTVQTTYILTKPSTYKEEGEGCYVAEFESSVFTTQMRTVVIPAVGCDGGSTCPSLHFTDRPAADNWAHIPIDWAVVNGITRGTTKTTFSPTAACTRAQFVTFLWRTMGSPEPELTENPFVDVRMDSYYYKSVLWAYENGITAGTTKTTFSPDKSCTRAQVVTFLWRTEGCVEPTITKAPFEDLKPTAYYMKAVLWAYEKGITTGTSATTFSPDRSCTRAEAVTVLYRAFAK